MKRLVIFAALLTACATPPEKIAAVQMSGAEYAGKDMISKRTIQMSAASFGAQSIAEQQRIATNDAVGVLLLGVPMGSIGGDMETAVAVEKGRLAAIDKAIAERC